MRIRDIKRKIQKKNVLDSKEKKEGKEREKRKKMKREREGDDYVKRNESRRMNGNEETRDTNRFALRANKRKREGRWKEIRA